MKHITLNLALVALIATFASTSSHALVLISAGNTPGGDNVLFNNNPPNGLQLSGILNNAQNTPVNFSSTQVLHANGGQARIEAANGANLTNVSVFLNPGFGFTQYVGNPFSATRNSNLTITVNSVDSNGVIEAPTVLVLPVGNGENFFTALASGGELITSVNLSNGSFQDLRQNRLTGVQSLLTHQSAVPEPGSVALLVGSVITGVGVLVRRRRN